MHPSSESTDRSLEEYLLFAIAFLGFVGAVGGMILSSAGFASSGVAISLLALWRFSLR